MTSRVSDAFGAHHVPFQQKNLDLNAFKELPESYAWIPLDNSPRNTISTSTETVPIIDLNGPNAQELIGHACKKWGVFQVINHGIKKSLIHDTEDAGRSLFSLPLKQKLKAARQLDGVTGYGVARISSFFRKLMWSEGFTIFGSPLEHARQLWPHDYQNFCDLIEEYEKEMNQLASKLMWLMLGSLGITKEDVIWAGSKGGIKEGNAAIQLNSYPACPDPDRAMGLAAHTDSTLLTILHQSNTCGLQVFQDGPGWVHVQPVQEALVVHVGDLLHILSNGSYPSVLHRALVNRTQHRLSVAYLYGPPAHVEISPLLKLLGPTHPPLYRPITWSEYLSTKATHFNKALSMLSYVQICIRKNNNIG